MRRSWDRGVAFVKDEVTRLRTHERQSRQHVHISLVASCSFISHIDSRNLKKNEGIVIRCVHGPFLQTPLSSPATRLAPLLLRIKIHNTTPSALSRRVTTYTTPKITYSILSEEITTHNHQINQNPIKQSARSRTSYRCMNKRKFKPLLRLSWLTS